DPEHSQNPPIEMLTYQRKSQGGSEEMRDRYERHGQFRVHEKCQHRREDASDAEAGKGSDSAGNEARHRDEGFVFHRKVRTRMESHLRSALSPHTPLRD